MSTDPREAEASFHSAHHSRSGPRDKSEYIREYLWGKVVDAKDAPVYDSKFDANGDYGFLDVRGE
jgi:hypothetical protein